MMRMMMIFQKQGDLHNPYHTIAAVLLYLV